MVVLSFVNLRLGDVCWWHSLRDYVRADRKAVINDLEEIFDLSGT